MADNQGAGKQPSSGYIVVASKAKEYVIPMLRVIAFLATASATLVMAFNKETQNFVVATIGNTPVKISLHAKFQHTPAFVAFVIANAMASLHSFLMLAFGFLSCNYDFKGLRFVIIAILDMMTIALVSGAASAAAFFGELGRNGNSHARWNKICDKFDTYCDRSGWAMLASFIGLLLLMVINSISIIKLAKLHSVKNSIVP